MTTKQTTSGSDFKLTALKSLNQPAHIQAWINDVKNAARTCPVIYIDEDGNKASFGHLGQLYSAGVTITEKTSIHGNERRKKHHGGQTANEYQDLGRKSYPPTLRHPPTLHTLK